MNDLVGTYSINEVFEIGSALELNQDSTFIYDWQYGLMSGTTKGSWYFSNHRIILNSEIQPKKRSDEHVIESRLDTCSNQTTIKVIDENSNPIAFASCVIYTDKTILNLITDIDGILICDVKPIKKIEISYLCHKNVVYRLKNDKYNFYIFMLQPENNYYQYFTNEKWKVKKGKIFKYGIFENRFCEKKYYEKIEIK